MESFQPKLHYEDLTDAVHDLVLALGGYKKVGPMLWPEKPAEEAAHLLRHCLNRQRREKLSPEQLALLLRQGREVDFHGAKHFLDDHCGYQRSTPLDPEDEVAKAQREFSDAVKYLGALAEKMERLGVTLPAGPLRQVK